MALKVFRDGYREVARREARVHWRLAPRWSPALVGVRDEANEPFALALEWADGQRLDEVLSRANAADEAASVRLAAVVAHAVGRALAELHAQGVRHGDVKAANVVVRDHVPSRDAAVDRGATLIDLSLATAVDAPLEGATPSHLAPEAPTSTGPETDLYAFGVMLASIVEAFPGTEPARWAAALTAPRPGSRPAAAFVADRAAALLELATDPAERRAARVASVRAAYLRTRAAELGGAPAPALVGLPRRWIGELGTPASTGATLEPLDVLGRARFLTALFGVPPADDVVRGRTEAELVSALVALADGDGPFTASALVGPLSDAPLPPPRSDTAEEALELARLLGRGRPSAELLSWAERRAPALPPTFRVLLADALLAVGEPGRAFVALGAHRGGLGALTAAEIVRRMGDAPRALALADVARERAELAPLAAVVAARLAWDRGDGDEALSLLAGVDGPGAAEVRGLVHYARGEFEEGLAVVSRAHVAGLPAWVRARLAGVEGMLHHARGEAAAAVAAFRRAADDALAPVDEATYLTGLAAAATEAGDTAVAIPAATRAALLFDELARPALAARAWLARASALAFVGSAAEAEEAAHQAVSRAILGGDQEARVYAVLVFGETRPAGDEGLRSLLAELPPSNDLRVAARRLLAAPESLGPAERTRFDEAAPHAPAAARLEWWGARAATTDAGGPGRERDGDGRHVLGQLLALQGTPAPAPSRAMALLAAEELARRIGDGEATRRFAAARRALAAHVRAHVAPAYAGRLAHVAWARGTDALPESASHDLEPAQIALLAGLTRALGGREKLRPLFDQVLDALLLWTGVERGVLLALAPDGSLVPRAARNLARADLTGEQRALSIGLARRALELGDVVVATDALATLGELHASVHAMRLRSVLAVPLMARGEALGVVYLDDRHRRGAFGPREIEWVRLLSAHAALAVADARDAVRLRRALRHAERARARLERDVAERDLEIARAKSRVVEAPREPLDYDGVVGRSEAMRRTMHVVARVSRSDVPVLIVGESGTGKELLARAIHKSGARRGRPFVTENCGALPEALLESTLFGHKKGAFTGATSSRAGLFEVADGGTLFLDEVGEMSPGMQAKLLRVLQDGEIRAVGDERARHVDVRVVAATHRDLSAMVKAGTFREDLFYRLNVVAITVPALRERPEDIPGLVAHLVEKHAGGRTVRITRAALDRLTAFPWPGNVRQLENEVRRALVLAGDRIDASELSPELLRAAEARRAGGTDLRSRLDALEAELVQEALDKTQGNQTRAAELLGVSRFGLQKMIKRLGLRN